MPSYSNRGQDALKQLGGEYEPGPAIQPQEDRGVTVRSLVFGVFFVLAISLLANTVRYILHASYMAYDHMPMGSLILFLLSILVCSALARRFGRAFVFSRSEWITIFAMGFISCLGPTYGVSGYLVGVIVTFPFVWNMVNWFYPTFGGRFIPSGSPCRTRG